MADNDPGDTEVVTQNTSEEVHISEVPKTEDKTAADFGVDQASFDKYYKDGDFDWGSYGKEQAYKQQQAKTAEPATADESATTDDAKAAVEQAGLDWGSLEQRIQADGDLSATDYEALSAIGIPESIARNYVDMMQRDAENIINDVVGRFGGQEQFESVYAQLMSNTPLEQRNRVDDLLRDPLTRNQGVSLAYDLAGLQAPTQAAQPVAPTPVASRGNTQATSESAPGFTSLAEQAAAQADPKYRTDPAFRDLVMRRIGNSTYDVNPRSHTSGL